MISHKTLIFASVLVFCISLANLADGRPRTVIELLRVKRQLPGVPKQFANIDVLGYLRNERAVRFQLKCLLYDGPCDTIGKYMKRYIPIWLRTQCRSCDDETKKQAGKLIKFFQEGYPKEWNDAIEKYGKGRFTEEEVARFESELGVNILVDPEIAASKGPATKLDTKKLESLAREALDYLKTTKKPFEISYGNSTSVVSIDASTLNKAQETLDGKRKTVKFGEIVSAVSPGIKTVTEPTKPDEGEASARVLKEQEKKEEATTDAKIVETSTKSVETVSLATNTTTTLKPTTKEAEMSSTTTQKVDEQSTTMDEVVTTTQTAMQKEMEDSTE